MRKVGTALFAVKSFSATCLSSRQVRPTKDENMQKQQRPTVRQNLPIHRAIQIPAPPARRLTPAGTGRVMKRARKLGRQGVLTPFDHRLLDALLFQCGSPLSGAVVVSYSALVRITGMCRATVTKGVKRLTGCGMLA